MRTLSTPSSLILFCLSTITFGTFGQSAAPGTGRLSMSNRKATAVAQRAWTKIPFTALTPANTDVLVGIAPFGVLTGVTNQISRTASLQLISYSANSYVVGVGKVTPTGSTPAGDFSVGANECNNPFLVPSPAAGAGHASLDAMAPVMCGIPITFTPTMVGTVEQATIDIPLTKVNVGGGVPSTDHILVPVIGIGTSSCITATSSILPLIPSHADNETVYCYFNSTGSISAANQVTYQYNPVGDTNTVSADLLSAVFVPGFQLSLNAIANQNSCATTATDGSSTNSTCTQTAAGVSQSPQQAASTLSSGGQFGLRVTYPLIDWRDSNFHAQVLATPRFSANINGIGGQQTPTNSTNFIPFVPAEGYFEWDAIAPASASESRLGLYVDVRTGYEHVSSQYADTIGLAKNNFALTQVSAGLLVLGSFTISGQKYIGPSQSFSAPGSAPVSSNNFGWTFQLQLAPATLLKTTKAGG